jgi:flagellar biosynthesis protein FlhF
MNVKRFTARNSREALRLVREALGDDAIVLSTKPAATGVEVMAMAPESLGRLEAMAAHDAARAPVDPAAVRAGAELAASSAEEDAERLSMSTLSFQDYVRKRMLKRRQASRDAAHASEPSLGASHAPSAVTVAPPPSVGSRLDMILGDEEALAADADSAGAPALAPAGSQAIVTPTPRAAAPVQSLADAGDDGLDAAASLRRDGDLLSELRAVKGLIEERFGVLAFMEKLQRDPAQARLAQKLLDCGFSPMLVRKMADGFKAEAGPAARRAAANAANAANAAKAKLKPKKVADEEADEEAEARGRSERPTREAEADRPRYEPRSAPSNLQPS